MSTLIMCDLFGGRSNWGRWDHGVGETINFFCREMGFGGGRFVGRVEELILKLT